MLYVLGFIWAILMASLITEPLARKPRWQPQREEQGTVTVRYLEGTGVATSANGASTSYSGGGGGSGICVVTVGGGGGGASYATSGGANGGNAS